MEKGGPGSPSMPREAIVRDHVAGNIIAMFNDETDAQVYADHKNNSDPAPATWAIISSLIRTLECNDQGLNESDTTVKAALEWLEANDPYPKPARLVKVGENGLVALFDLVT